MQSDLNAKGSTETFDCFVSGSDVIECRFQAWQELENALGILPRTDWKMAKLSHGLNPEAKEDGSDRIVCHAQFVYAPDEGNISADLDIPLVPATPGDTAN